MKASAHIASLLARQSIAQRSADRPSAIGGLSALLPPPEFPSKSLCDSALRTILSLMPQALGGALLYPVP